MNDIFDGLIKWFFNKLDEWRQGLWEEITTSDFLHLSGTFHDHGMTFSESFLMVVGSSYALVIVVGGFLLMTHETLQTRYSVREIAPRLVIGLLLAGLSAPLLDQSFSITNDLVDAFASGDLSIDQEWECTEPGYDEDGNYSSSCSAVPGTEVERSSFASRLSARIFEGDDTPTLFDIFMIILAIICLAVLFITSLIRNLVWFFVVALAPLGLACHGLPATQQFATMWWRLMGACMASCIGQALLVWTYHEVIVELPNQTLLEWNWTFIYVVLLVWFMWKVQGEVFKIARGRPVAIPGSRLAQALVMSKLIDGASGGRAGGAKKRNTTVPGTVWGRDMTRPPWKRKPHQDRFPDLPPEPAGFNEWAGFRNDAEARATHSPAPARGPEQGPQSPLDDAAPVSVDGSPSIGGNATPYAPAAETAPRPDHRLSTVTSPLDDASPDPAAGTRPAPARETHPLAAVPDGTLIERPEAQPVVQVRRDEVVPLAHRREEALDANQRRDQEAAAEAAAARARAEQQQAELRAKAKAAMARMAASPSARPHAIPAAGPGHHAPPPPPGKAPGSGPALGSKRPAGGEQ
ncbi:hypothetical protein O1R50_09250 [Glycomyces luteolus]|uniref:TrbL/VirB6 plasmid conjugal transfer protein n=1 Tax=Glycomyces luteolus TaxID=2670330 RepID=A0A9X3P6M9_9ACTN|nr:hypothetical protein [Glycomyces luteolus]MDA1359808.1 hypothetical protein [Glycomyces luteolus]